MITLCKLIPKYMKSILLVWISYFINFKVEALNKEVESQHKYSQQLQDVIESERNEFEREREVLHEDLKSAKEQTRQEFLVKVWSIK